MVDKRKRATAPRSAAVLWALKLYGDINENHAGGNATNTLFDRIRAINPELFPTTATMTSSLNNLHKQGKIARLTKGGKTYAVRLLLSSGDAMPSNPFESNGHAVLAVDSSLPLLSDHPNDKNLMSDEWRDWPISFRLALVEAVSASVREDMDAFKSGVVDGL